MLSFFPNILLASCRFQGWGQVRLSNVLPVTPSDPLDLYVADQEWLTAFTKRVYFVEVSQLKPCQVRQWCMEWKRTL